MTNSYFFLLVLIEFLYIFSDRKSSTVHLKMLTSRRSNGIHFRFDSSKPVGIQPHYKSFIFEEEINLQKHNYTSILRAINWIIENPIIEQSFIDNKKNTLDRMCDMSLDSGMISNNSSELEDIPTNEKNFIEKSRLYTFEDFPNDYLSDAPKEPWTYFEYTFHGKSKICNLKLAENDEKSFSYISNKGDNFCPNQYNENCIDCRYFFIRNIMQSTPMHLYYVNNYHQSDTSKEIMPVIRKLLLSETFNIELVNKIILDYVYPDLRMIRSDKEILTDMKNIVCNVINKCIEGRPIAQGIIFKGFIWNGKIFQRHEIGPYFDDIINQCFLEETVDSSTFFKSLTLKLLELNIPYMEVNTKKYISEARKNFNIRQQQQLQQKKNGINNTPDSSYLTNISDTPKNSYQTTTLESEDFKKERKNKLQSLKKSLAEKCSIQ